MYIVEELISDSSVSRFTNDDGICYGIRILGRGENLFFQEQDKGLICVFDAVHGALYSRSITNWEGYKKMSSVEKDRVIKVLGIAYKELFKKDMLVTDARI